ncbi:sugar transferase [Pseudonocardia nematodicida]|uniref:Sugar transferase n=1 Tax=Pseudonocardia nematodicida TaxID=1206997 RepID=A0ABV1K3S8_9PSEU
MRATTTRAIDLLGAATGLLLLGIPMLVVAGLVRLTSPGPALFRQRRVGRDGRLFTLYKFRTMRADADDSALRRLIEGELTGRPTQVGGSYKLHGDDRITPVGRWLRSSSVDELPQLINVLCGRMSLVGPRPCLPWEAEMFPSRYRARFSVRPGITGLWQVSGRSTLGTLDMLALDVRYVQDRSVARDLSILAMTVPALLRDGGAR